jgi:hypothetical protein
MEQDCRMLILDYALSSEAIVEGVAYHFARAGCRADYRPYYPNLVWDDLSTYQVIALLAGRTPDFPSGMMSVDEVVVAGKFVREGGTLILGPNLEGGEGANERRLFNRLLGDLEIPIQILDEKVDDAVNCYTGPLWDRPFYAPVQGHPTAEGGWDRLAFERTTPLRVGENTEVVLTTFETAVPDGRMPVMAIGQSGKGQVLVAGRYLLNATGIPLRISGEPLIHPELLRETEAFLTGLAKHVLGLASGEATWTPVNPCVATEMVPEEIRGPGFDRSPVLDRFPEGEHVVALSPLTGSADGFDRDLARRYEELPDDRLYGWIRREGVRASWGRTVDPDPEGFSRQAVEEVAGALSSCGANLFWGISNCQAMSGFGYSGEERASVADRWRWTAEALDGTEVKWYPTLDYRYFREEKTRCFGAQGQELQAPSPMDLAFWNRGWRDSLCTIAEYSLNHGCIGGITIDVELYAHPPAFNYYSGYGFEDLCFEFALDRLKGRVDTGLTCEARSLALTDRFNWLRSHGMLGMYFGTLSAEVERICREIRDDVWRINPDLLFASYIFTTPCNWFEMGIYRGLSSPERPLILMTFNVRSGRMLEHLRRERVYAYHASVALLGMVKRDEYETLFRNSFQLGHGYWMNNINAVLEGAPESCESPGRQGISPEDAIRIIGEANCRTRPT